MGRTLCVDFDGVLHSYTSGWQGFGVVDDPPVPGAIEWLRALVADERFDVCVYSSRSKDIGGLVAMRLWLVEHGLRPGELARIAFPSQKPAAFLTIDDRAVCFDGTFPEPDDMATFVPWNKR